MILKYMSMLGWCLLLPLCSTLPSQTAAPSGRRQAEKSIVFELQASPKEVLPLFGPVRESDWSPAWKPSFIYPAAGSNTREGTVFTTGRSDGGIAVWILVEYSLKRKIVRYAVVTADQSTAEIWVRLSPKPGNRTMVQVTQRRTSLRA